MSAMSYADYNVTIRRGLLGWLASVTAPNGDKVPINFGLGGTYASRASAEKAALAAIRHHEEIHTMTGDELAKRVEGEPS